MLNSRSWLCKSMWAMWVWCVATSLSRPQDRAGWLDVHCISKKNDSFPLVTGIPGQIQLFPWVSHSANLYLKTGFAPELEAMWRRTQHCTSPSTQLLFTARFKEIFVKELPSTNPEPLTAIKPSKPLQIYWQHVWRRSSLAGCRRPTDPLHSSCCPFYAQLPHFVKQLVSTFLWINHKIFLPKWCWGGRGGKLRTISK